MELAKAVSENVDDELAQSTVMPWQLVVDVAGLLTGDRGSSLQWIECQLGFEGEDRNRQNARKAFREAGLTEYDRLLGGSIVSVPSGNPDNKMVGLLQSLEMCGKDREPETPGERRRVYPKNFKRER